MPGHSSTKRAADAAIKRQANAVDFIINGYFASWFGLHICLISACVLLITGVTLPSRFWATIFSLSAIFTLSIFWAIRWNVNRRDPGLSGLSAIFAIVAGILSPLPPLWSDIMITAIYIMLIGGVLARTLPAEDLTLTPLYLSVILISHDSTHRLIVYFILMMLGMSALWWIRQFYKAFGFLLGFIILVTYSVYVRSNAITFPPMLLAVFVLPTLSWVFFYGITQSNSRYSELYNLLIQSVVAITILALVLLWWRQRIFHHGYWWPLGFVTYVIVRWFCMDRREMSLKENQEITRSTSSGGVCSAAFSRCPPEDGSVRATQETVESVRNSGDATRVIETLPVTSSTALIWIVITAIGGMWLHIPQTEIAYETSRGLFWLWVFLSFLLTNCVLVLKREYKTQFLLNAVVIVNVLWTAIALKMVQSFRDIIAALGVFSSNKAFELSSFALWNNWDFVRLAGLIVLVLLAIITCGETTYPVKPIPWWHGLITTRHAVRIRQLTYEIDEWGKDIPLIGGSFKTLTGFWKAIRRFKTDGKPARVYDIGVLIGGGIGGIALVLLADVLLRTAAGEGGGYQSLLRWWADATPWLLGALVLYVIG
jgi:hypothetical protein